MSSYKSRLDNLSPELSPELRNLGKNDEDNILTQIHERDIRMLKSIHKGDIDDIKFSSGIMVGIAITMCIAICFFFAVVHKC